MKVFKTIAIWNCIFVAYLWEVLCLAPNISNSDDGLKVTFEGSRGSLILNVNLGADTVHVDCLETHHNQQCFQSSITEKSATIKNIGTGFSTISCIDITRDNPGSKQADCIDLGDALWYGGSEMKVQRFPIQDTNLGRVPYITGDFGRNPLGGIMDTLWLNSDGFVVYVDRQTPLFLSFNDTGDNRMCFSASYDEFPFSGASAARKTHKELKYTVCSSNNVREGFQYAASRWFTKPIASVEPSVVTYPIWSTWAQYYANINATTVIDYAKQIAANGFRASHLEIDDKWETCYGELEFDLGKFPDPAETVAQIKSMGFNVSIWIHPYTNVDCPSFKDPSTNQYLLKDANTDQPLQCSWWNGVGGYLDTTNPAATANFVRKVTLLRNTYGIDSFKFDSGEVGYISPNFVFNNSEAMATPNDFTRQYVDTASQLGNGVEVRVGYNTQKYPIFVRMLDKDSNWGYTNGLKTLITTALHMSVIGYPFNLPDMIGGNNYGSSDLPDRRLFIRWLQVNVFMPALQFSIAPWDYDEEVVSISKKMVSLHEQYAPLIIKLAEEAVATGNPIVRPLWWIAPGDPDALKTELQYLLGNDVLVAPIVEEGAISRDIYLPAGIWEDQLLNGTYHLGPVWLRDYKALLDQLPFFIRSG